MTNQTEGKISKSKFQALNIFVGTWITHGTIHGSNAKKPAELHAVDIYEWLPGKFFMLHRANAQMAGVLSQSIEIMGYDAARSCYVTRSYDDQGTIAEFTARLTGNDWAIDGECVRFKGAFKKDATMLAGNWEQLGTDGKWATWIELELRKLT